MCCIKFKIFFNFYYVFGFFFLIISAENLKNLIYSYIRSKFIFFYYDSGLQILYTISRYRKLKV